MQPMVRLGRIASTNLRGRGHQNLEAARRTFGLQLASKPMQPKLSPQLSVLMVLADELRRAVTSVSGGSITSVRHGALSRSPLLAGDQCAPRQIADAGNRIPRAANCGAAFFAFSCRFRCVPGASHTWASGWTLLVQRGLRRPASSATFSAIPAGKLSDNDDSDNAGAALIATPAHSGRRRSWSAKARSRVQCGSPPSNASDRSATRITGSGVRGPSPARTPTTGRPCSGRPTSGRPDRALCATRSDRKRQLGEHAHASTARPVSAPERPTHPARPLIVSPTN